MYFFFKLGISDNLDPCVSQTAVRKIESENVSPLGKDQNLTDSNKCNQANNSPPFRIFHRSSLISLASHAFSSRKSNESNIKIPTRKTADDQTIKKLPHLSPNERYQCSLAHMNEILLRNKNLNEKISAQETCTLLTEHVIKLTALKRNLLEKGLLDASHLANEEKVKFQAALREKALNVRGKLDHASIVAYEVGTIKNTIK